MQLPAFPPFPTMFSKGLLYRVVKSRDCVVKSSPFHKREILDCSTLKDFADNNFEFDENGIKFSKRVENTVGKGEITPFPRCFQKTCTVDR